MGYRLQVLMMSKLFFLLSFLIVFLLLTRCERVGDCYIQPGKVIKVERETKNLDFVNSIELKGNVSLFLTKGEENSIYLQSGENLIDGIICETEDSLLRIYDEVFCNWLSGYKHEMKVFLTLDELKQITYSGSAGLYTTDTFNIGNTGKLEIIIGDASGVVNMKIKGGHLELKHYFGVIDLKMSGQVNTCTVHHVARGRIDLFHLKTSGLKIKSASVNDARVYALERLQVQISGSGNVYYRGNPHIELTRSGSGNLMKNDD